MEGGGTRKGGIEVGGNKVREREGEGGGTEWG